MKKQLSILGGFLLMTGINYQAWAMKEEEKKLMEKAAKMDAGIDKKQLETLAQKLNNLEIILMIGHYPLECRMGLQIAQEPFEKLYKDKEKIDALASRNKSLQNKWLFLISIKENIDRLLK